MVKGEWCYFFTLLKHNKNLLAEESIFSMAITYIFGNFVYNCNTLLFFSSIYLNAERTQFLSEQDDSNYQLCDHGFLSLYI